MLTLTPDFAAFCAAARHGSLVPVCAARLGDLLTPMAAMLRIRGAVRRPFLLESAEGGERIGRFSYLGGDPMLELRGDADGLVELRPGREPRHLPGDPVERLAEVQSRYRSVSLPGVPPFSGGGVGYVGYDAVRWVERIPDRHGPTSLPWLHLGFYDTLLAFDHLRHRVLLVANAHVRDPHDRGHLREAYDDAVQRIEALADRLGAEPESAAPLDEIDPSALDALGVEAEPDDARFRAIVSRAQEYIAAGDIFQAVLSRRLTCAVDASPVTVYRALRAINPSPYMYYVDTGDAAIVGSSPEMLVRIEDDRIETRPIAGTRRRDPDPDRDRELERGLLADEKERAEHLMLVDLGRNDIGRVARYGTVELPEFMQVERYSHVMHIVSSVRGRLREGISGARAMFSAFPAGTVSGAPKIRAMEIIDELEPVSRGVYAGAILYSDFAGNLNSCIAIRTIVLRDGRAEVQAGAGIVADSVPERELEETREKAAAPLQALAWAQAATAAAVPSAEPGRTGGAGGRR